MPSQFLFKERREFDKDGKTIEVRNNILNEEAKKFLTRKNSDLLEFKYWFLDKGKFRNDNWFELMPLVVQLKQCQQLHLFKSQDENIIKPLIYTRFTALRNLSLDHNLIRNIQALQFVDAPNIKHLNLQNNLIINSKALAKTEFKTISIIQLYNNPIKEIYSLQRVNYPKISEFYLSHINPRTDISSIYNFLEDVSVFAKFQHFEKYSLKKGPHVIQQKIVQQKIQNIALNSHN